MRPLLLCYDGSPQAELAVRCAGTLLRPRQAVLLLIPPSSATLAERGRRVAREAGLETVAVLEPRRRRVAAAVVDQARALDASAIVAGCSGVAPSRPGLPGALLRRADRPLLIGPRWAPPPAAGEPVLIGYDGSPAAREAVAAAGALLTGRDAIVAAFMPAVDKAAAEGARAAAAAGLAARPLGIDASGEEEAQPWRRLLRAATDADAVCVVVGHGPSSSGVAGTSFGLVSEARLPVLVVPGLSPEDALALRGVPVVLRDGSHVRIRPGRHTDHDLVLRGFERLGPESRYQRYLTGLPKLDEKSVRYMIELDHHDHEAMIALDERGEEGIGDAFYVRDPQRPDRAEVAVTVVDEWQGRGLGTVLLDAIGARARDEGIRTFTALMLDGNETMMHLFERLGPVRIVDCTLGTVEIEVPIPSAGGPPAQ